MTCDDHNGHNAAYVQQWDGTKWVKASDWIQPIKEKVVPLIDKAAADYVVAFVDAPGTGSSCRSTSAAPRSSAGSGRCCRHPAGAR